MGYWLGVGKYDITGPCAQVGFMGMSNYRQTGKGLHTRLFARAFIIDEPQSARVAIVVVDLAMCSHAVKAEVVRKLAADDGLRSGGLPIYRDDNLLIAATHTHSGPGGYSHFLAYNASIMGFNKQNFEVIANGVYQAIRKAHDSLRPGRITVARGAVAAVGGNRSMPAYEQNPADERALYPEPYDKSMILLKFVAESGEILGTVNWCAVHPTNMGETNQLISGDNKGYAEELMEKHVAALSGLRDWRTDSVSAFANSCCGDSSPNMATGFPNGRDDLAHALNFGRIQFEAARDLLAGGEELSGPVACIHRYVDLSNITIEKTTRRTWPPAMGYGMVNGSSEDSKGLECSQWKEGTTKQNFKPGFCFNLEAFRILSVAMGIKWPAPGSLPTGFVDGHGDKEIVFPLAFMSYKNHPLAPSVLPLQILRIGQLAFIAHPGELTVMSGRRMRAALAPALGCDQANIILATYANAYSSYTATPEEYAVQHYEGASTLFGPWTLDAYLQENRRMAKALSQGANPDSGPAPLEIPDADLMKTPEYAWPDQPFGSLPFGGVASNLDSSYQYGDTVRVTFLGGYPNYDLRTGRTFLAVEKKGPHGWPGAPEVCFTDHDSCTFFRWDLASGSSLLTVEWGIPREGVDPGTYRIRYFGSFKASLGQGPLPIIGVSPEFRVG